MKPNQTLCEKGDFTRLAASLRASGEELVGKLNIEEGHAVLDLACGDGTTAIPSARLGANVLGVDIARNLVEAGNRRAKEEGLTNIEFQHGDASDLSELDDERFDRVASVFGAMFAPRPFDVAREMVRVTRPGGRIVMGNWIPDDRTLVAQIFKISSSYAPPPPEGFVSPMTWGMPDQVVDRFVTAGVADDSISFERDTFILEQDMSAADFLLTFRQYFGPTMNAFEAAEANGRAGDLFTELDVLFNEQNTSTDLGRFSFPAAYLRVTVDN